MAKALNKFLTSTAILVIGIFAVQFFIDEGMDDLLNCGTGWKGDVNNKQCYLESNPSITKEITTVS